MIASDLVGFRVRPFRANQILRADRQVCSESMEARGSVLERRGIFEYHQHIVVE